MTPSRRTVLATGASLLGTLAGCSSAFTRPPEPDVRRPPPLIEVAITNRDFEPYPLSLLIQANEGEIHSWNRYELPAATKSEGVKTSQTVAVGTGNMCLDEFLVSVSIDEEETWTQIDGQTYVEEHEDIPERQGAAPEGEIIDGELTLYPRLDNVLEGQCSNGTRNSETTTSTASRERDYPKWSHSLTD